MATKAVLFDLLTALLDSWSLWNAAAGSESAGRQWRTRYLELTYGCGAYRPYEDLVTESAVDTGLPADAATTLLASWDSLRPWPEAADVLRTLRARGYRLGVVTNCSSDLGRRAVARCGVQFDAVVTAEEAGFYKPHPKPYNDILLALGVDPADALFVAGSSADVPGASGVGMQVVWHNRVGLPARPGSAPLREGRTLQEALQGFLGYKGMRRSEISTPSLYLNRRKFTENCERMRQRAAGLQAQFRVHIKTHKTVEGTEIGLSYSGDRIVVSTLREIEHVAPLIRKGKIRSVSSTYMLPSSLSWRTLTEVMQVLYGLPPAKSYISRLASLKKRLGFELILMIDHPSQISMLEASGFDERWSIFIKVDCGTHRAGLEPQSPLLTSLIQTALKSDKIHIYGFYCHSGHSYGSHSLAEAEGHLLNEISCASSAARQCLQYRPDHPQLTISVGATPTAHAASAAVAQQIKDLPGKLELHAGNFGLLDLQQVSTGLVTLDEVSSWVEAEVCSVYPERQEVLVNIGTLGLAREPGREPSVWGRAMILPGEKDLDKGYAWNVVRLSQEHGILAPRMSDPKEKEELVNRVQVGARVRIIPQHACITGAMYDSYIVVDEDDGECVDEWVRCRGW